MKKTAGVLAVLAMVALGLLLFGDSSDRNDSTSEPVSSNAGSSPLRQETEDTEPSTDDELSLTRDEFDQLSQEQQDNMLEDFVLDFWAKELGLSETDAKEESLSLEIFNRPYMHTLTERKLFQLSPEDRERAMAEVMENLAEVRSYVMNNVIAEAESLLADKDYVNAEAYFVHVWEVGRELSVNKEGLIITRLAGMASEKVALNGLVKLYTQTGDNSKAQMAREQLSEIEKEAQEIKRMAKESEATR